VRDTGTASVHHSPSKVLNPLRVRARRWLEFPTNADFSETGSPPGGPEFPSNADFSGRIAPRGLEFPTGADFFRGRGDRPAYLSSRRWEGIR
jgi:hypothetical protein